MRKEISPIIWLPVIALTIIVVSLAVFFTRPKEEKIPQIKTQEAEEITLPEKETPLPEEEITPQRELEISPTIGKHPWQSYRHDNQNTGRSPYLGPEKPSLKWKRGEAESSWIAIGQDGTIYTDLETGLLEFGLSALSPDGSLKWNSELTFQGLTLAEDGTIYLTDLDSEFVHREGKSSEEWFLQLYSIDSEGKINWRKELTPRIPNLFTQEMNWVLSAPLIGNEGTIYVVAGFIKKDEEKNWIKLLALSSQGDLKWEFPIVAPRFIANPCPALGKDGTIYILSGEGILYALTPEGKLKWRYEIEAEGVSFNSRFDPAPLVVIDNNDNIYFVANLLEEPFSFNERGYLYSINSNGSLNFKLNLDDWAELFSPPAIGPKGTIYLTAGCCGRDETEKIIGKKEGIILALNPDGKVKWVFGLDEEEIMTSPTVDNRGVVYFGDKKGNLYALNPNGTLKWEYEIGQPPEASLVEGSIIIGKDKTLYFAGIFSEGEDLIYAIGEAE